jgi:hypothetical protein
MDQGLTMASDFAALYPDMLDAMSYWDATSQSWISALNLGYWEGDFTVQPGSVMMIASLANFTAYSIGNMPATNATYNLLVGLNDIMIPLNRSDITMAGQVGDEIQVVDAMSYWDNTTQSWVSALNLGYWEGDFPVHIGFPIQLAALSQTTWPSRASLTPIMPAKQSK